MQMLLDAREAARQLRLSLRSLRALIARREIPVVRIGRRTLFAAESLSAFVRSHEHPKPPGASPVVT